MEQCDVLATVDLIFEHLSKRLQTSDADAIHVAMKEAKMAVTLVTLHCYSDTSIIVDSLMPKDTVFL